MDTLDVGTMNLGFMLSRNALHYPDKLAIVVEDIRLTYKEFNDRVNQTANALLNVGIKKGDRVAMLLTNSLEMLELYWGTAKIGAVIVPLNPMVQGKDNMYIIKDCQPKVLVVNDDYIAEIGQFCDELSFVESFIHVGEHIANPFVSYHQLIESAPTTEPENNILSHNDCNIMYSSGTTGLPKGIVHSHHARVMYSFLFGIDYNFTIDSIVLAAGSLVFNGSLAFMYPTICAGATFILMPKFTVNDAINIIEQEKVTHTTFVPTQVISLLDSPVFEPKRLESLQVLMSLGSPLSATRKKEFNNYLPNRLYELYGLTEGLCTILRPHEISEKPSSVGSPMIFNEFKIVDKEMKEVPNGEIGEIIGRGPTLMTRYYNNEVATWEAFHDGMYLKTGDIGYQDDLGFIYIIDRKKDLIISGGINIYPSDIETVILQNEAVSECAVFAIPHEKWGETPVAHVTLKPNHSVSSDDLIEWINERVHGRYQRLHSLKIVDHFPRNTSGKILKRKIRDEYSQAIQKQTKGETS